MDNDKGKHPMREEISQLVKRGVTVLGKGPKILIVSMNEDVKRHFLVQTRAKGKNTVYIYIYFFFF